jgi:S1-C subfamily serine protease
MGIGHGVWHNSQPVSSNGSSPGSGSNGLGPGGNSTGPSSGNSGQGGSNGQGASNAIAAAGAVSNELVDISVNLGYAQAQAEGTGIVLNSNGLVLTNNHVIAGATQILARDVGNNRQYTATVVGYDRSHDVALVQLSNASALKFVQIGDSDKVSPGDSVVGIGNAGGLNGAPSTAPGTVTALDQSITAQDESMNTSEKLSGLIETNCDIQPGDSGGALINAAGQVVGVDTAASVGFSFATQGNQGYTIPINQAMQIVSQIQSGQGNQTVHIGQTAFLGVEVEAANSGSGAQVQKAIPGDPAAAAGIAANDIITSLGGSPVTSPDSLTQLIGRYHPGDRVPVTWQDSSGASHTATVTMGNGPAQ